MYCGSGLRWTAGLPWRGEGKAGSGKRSWVIGGAVKILFGLVRSERSNPVFILFW